MNWIVGVVLLCLAASVLDGAFEIRVRRRHRGSLEPVRGVWAEGEDLP